MSEVIASIIDEALAKMGEIGGRHSTHSTLRLWDADAGCYHDVHDLVRGRDARTEILALHNPPAVIVVSTRYGMEPPRTP